MQIVDDSRNSIKGEPRPTSDCGGVGPASGMHGGWSGKTNAGEDRGGDRRQAAAGMSPSSESYARSDRQWRLGRAAATRFRVATALVPGSRGATFEQRRQMGPSGGSREGEATAADLRTGKRRRRWWRAARSNRQHPRALRWYGGGSRTDRRRWWPR
ncbi:hypothetical protein Syun_001174 [Stephania yunnanensis]|uniref:Uncharacterized protein n=1 Tax=Stephania yunnanensis TaxID=152371 RepID=A0AAP0LHB6_9MAGN